MESKKGSGAVSIGSASTSSNSFYEREASTTRRMTQRIRDSVDLRRQSRSSLTSEHTRSTRSASVSCVTRQASADDCAKQRFIVWAAVKRNRSVRMAASDRLRCPLLRCGEQFNDHETMLRHLHGCRHLEAGEYLCYECMRVEKFNDGNCKCCLGHQTKRRRILNAAKKVFSTLGHKSRKEGSCEVGQDDFAIPPPPSYDSLDIEQEQELQQPIEPEISGIPVCEMDAEPMFPVELGSVNYEVQHDDSHPVDVNNSLLPPANPFLKPRGSPNALQSLQNNNGSRPSLTLDTYNASRPNKVPRTNYLSPSSSLRSNNSCQSIISPMSAGSGMWTLGSTIDTTLASPITPFSSDVESASLSRENSCKFPKDFPPSSLLSNWDPRPEKSNILDNMKLGMSDVDYTLNNVSELPGDIPLDMSVPRSWANDPLLFSFESKENYSWSSTVDTEVNVLFTGDTVNPDMGDEVFGYDTKTLISHTWDTLKEHLAYSIPNIGHINNDLARQLEAFSPKDIVSKGLESLRSILGGVNPTNPLDYLCFVHVIYAFSVIVHEDDISSRMHTLFKQALAYRGFLTARDRDAYSAIVAAIWEPKNPEELNTSLGRSSSLKGKDPELRANSSTHFRNDPLMSVAQNFLDDLELSMLNENHSTRPLEVVTSEIYSTHIAETGPSSLPTSDPLVATAGYIVRMLSQKFGTLNDSLNSRLRAVGQKVSSGYITTTRRLELELLQTGKMTLTSPELFDSFIPEVRELCDPIYGERGNSRNKYHKLGVTLVESLMPTLGIPDAPITTPGGVAQGQESNSDFTLDIPDDSDPLAEFLKEFDSSAFVENFIIPPAAPLQDTINPSTGSTGRTAGSRTTEGTAINQITIDPASLSHTGSDTEGSQPAQKNKRLAYTPDYAAKSPMPTIAPTPNAVQTEAVGSPSVSELNASGQKAEANDCCEICGYRPKGDPQWFKGSMAKHKKLQHSTDPPKIYKCSYPGCTSAYKNRPDNLRQHQIEKGHFVGGEAKQKKLGKKRKLDDE